MPVYKIGYFVGSLSSTSINRVLSRALIRLAPEGLEFTEIPIGNLPLYSQDFDDHYPPEATELKEAIARADAVLFVTPEYNRSIPGALKNAIDWASRPWGQNSFHRVPGPRGAGPDRSSAPLTAVPQESPSFPEGRAGGCEAVVHNTTGENPARPSSPGRPAPGRPVPGSGPSVVHVLPESRADVHRVVRAPRVVPS